MRLIVPLFLLGLLVAACGGNPDDDDATVEVDCNTFWGAPPDSGRLYVQDGAAGTTGAQDDAFGELQAAIDQSRDTGERQIVLGEGTFEGSLLLNNEVHDNGLGIVGCGETTIVEGPPDSSVFEVRGVHGVAIRNLTIQDSWRAIVIWDGAGDPEPILLQGLLIKDAQRFAVLVDGVSTRAVLSDVTVDGVAPEVDGFGWGVVIQTGANSDAQGLTAPTTLNDVHVSEAHGVGILVTGGWVTIDDSTVSDTLVSDGLARGIQIQEYTAATLTNVDVTGSSDTGIFIRKPGRSLPEGDGMVHLNGGEIRMTSPVEDGGDGDDDDSAASGPPPGDGLVVSDGGEGLDPALLQVTIADFLVEDSTRMDMLVEGATVTIESWRGPGSLVTAGTQLGGDIVDAPFDVEPQEELLAVQRLALEPEELD